MKNYSHKKIIASAFVLSFIAGFLTAYAIPNPFAPNEIEAITVQEVAPVIETTVEEVKPKEIYLGHCIASAYCKENYPHICNNGNSTYTATMTTPTVGRTIAVDPTVIPYGSEVIINGHTYIAEDCGGAIKGNRVDILFATHEEALTWGRRTVEVSYIPKGDE